RILLTPNERFGNPFRYDSFGAVLEDVSEGMRVMALRPGGSAERTGLMRGDVITAVGGSAMTVKAFRDLLGRGGSYRLDGSRGKERKPLTLAVKNVLR